ncbi:hypothetical protein Sango_1145400 [Sesamum angolense]|uniref:Uncharacterized protein n=1 Tax=Sesamum angolense TaxID=2727404 RepID=A0AAE1WW61_9LAMI|nr:hypothetical protein Sango_1145400 [Sesamum angolense]
MKIGVLVAILGGHSLDFVCFLIMLSSLGKLRSNVQCITFFAQGEYRRMEATICELKWISYLLHDLHVPVQLLFPMRCDNQVVLYIIANLFFTKELSIWILIVIYVIAASKVTSKDQLADLFTKSLHSVTFASLVACSPSSKSNLWGDVGIITSTSTQPVFLLLVCRIQAKKQGCLQLYISRITLLQVNYRFLKGVDPHDVA